MSYFSSKSFVFAAFLIYLGFFWVDSARAKHFYNTEQTDIHLITIGIGPDIEQHYGHTVLRILDKSSGRDQNFNWGTFDFEDEDYFINFFKGRLKYWLSLSSFRTMMLHYKYIENRSIIQDKLNLSLQQKDAFLNLIDQNLKRERHFWYHFFYNNCSTIPRDYINQALGGVLQKSYKDQKASKNLRNYVRDHLNEPPLVAFLLEIVLNSDVDREVSKWTEMFYPIKLREYLKSHPAVDDKGELIEDSSLLVKSSILNQNDYTQPEYSLFPDFLYFLSPFLLLLGLFSLALSFFKNSVLQSCFLRIYALISVPYSVFSFVLSTAMLVFWLFSGHELLKHNANLLFLWPTDLMLCIVVLPLLVFAKLKSPFLINFLKISAAGHLLCLLLGYLAYFLGFIEQDLSLVMSYFLPVLGLYWLLSYRVAQLLKAVKTAE